MDDGIESALDNRFDFSIFAVLQNFRTDIENQHPSPLRTYAWTVGFEFGKIWTGVAILRAIEIAEVLYEKLDCHFTCLLIVCGNRILMQSFSNEVGAVDFSFKRLQHFSFTTQLFSSTTVFLLYD